MAPCATGTGSPWAGFFDPEPSMLVLVYLNFRQPSRWELGSALPGFLGTGSQCPGLRPRPRRDLAPEDPTPSCTSPNIAGPAWSALPSSAPLPGPDYELAWGLLPLRPSLGTPILPACPREAGGDGGLLLAPGMTRSSVCGNLSGRLSPAELEPPPQGWSGAVPGWLRLLSPRCPPL